MRFLLFLGAILIFWLLVETVMRLLPYRTGYYSSLPQSKIAQRQEQYAVKAARGCGWVHLAWIADPDNEVYCIEKRVEMKWLPAGEERFGSFLSREGGYWRVLAVAKRDGKKTLIGEMEAYPQDGPAPLYMPWIAGPWKRLFQPKTSGSYINDHTFFQDANGDWRMIGITSKTEGNYNAERYFAVARSAEFPPDGEMEELEPAADFGELAWAPDVVRNGSTYHLLWSPQKLHQMTSKDGIAWENHQVTLSVPYHKFFRDPMVIEAADGLWLLFTTARGRFYSQVDIYQSFDLCEWQYIRTALRSGWGSERNSAFASTESPVVIPYRGRYYLSLTYNNGTTFLSGLLLLFRKWLRLSTYNDTLVFHADNPYDFGIYHGRKRTPNLLTELKTHAPEWVYVSEKNQWYITTAGWPWVASLTSGEVAAAPLEWQIVEGSTTLLGKED